MTPRRLTLGPPKDSPWRASPPHEGRKYDTNTYPQLKVVDSKEALSSKNKGSAGYRRPPNGPAYWENNPRRG